MAFPPWQPVALDKHPGVRPTGIGDTLKHLISKAVFYVTWEVTSRAVGCQQLCAGLESAIEAVIFAMRSILEDEGTEVALMDNTANAFNSLNRKAALRKTHILCPSIHGHV